MSQFIRFTLCLAFVPALLMGSIGCNSEAPPAGKTLPPPAQPQSDPAAMPTEGEPAGEAAPKEAAAPQSLDPLALPTEGDPTGEPEVSGLGGEPSTVEAAPSAEVQAALASLSTTDRAAALRQKICPVSGEPLGSMGAPEKVSVAGHEVFICCEGCKDPLLEDPTTHLAKIGLKPQDASAVQ